MRFFALVCIPLFLTTGCYMSHERGAPAHITLDLNRPVTRTAIGFSTRIGGPSWGLHLMQFAAINTGEGPGTLNRIVFDTRVVSVDADGIEHPASIHDVLTSCLIYHVSHPIPDEGDPMYSARIEDEQIVFEHAGLVVGPEFDGSVPDAVQEIFLHCRVSPNPDAMPFRGVLRAWLSLDPDDGATLLEGEPSSVHGTISLEENTDPDIPLAETAYVEISFTE